MERTLDRLVEFDERSRLYPAVRGIEQTTLRSYTWSCDVFNDQGREGACVGFAWSHELSARPKIVRRDAEWAQKIYRRAQQIDYWPGEDYSGTSVLAGVKAVMEQKNTLGVPLVQEYRWAFGTEDVVKVIGRKGPVVLGVNWYSGMWNTDENGFVHVDGDNVGGHAILANGVAVRWKDKSKPKTFDNLDLDKSFVKLHNSWGPNWGVGGRAKITVRDLDTLLKQQGEACIPVKRTFDR